MKIVRLIIFTALLVQLAFCEENALEQPWYKKAWSTVKSKVEDAAGVIGQNPLCLIKVMGRRVKDNLFGPRSSAGENFKKYLAGFVGEKVSQGQKTAMDYKVGQLIQDSVHMIFLMGEISGIAYCKNSDNAKRVSQQGMRVGNFRVVYEATRDKFGAKFFLIENLERDYVALTFRGSKTIQDWGDNLEVSAEAPWRNLFPTATEGSAVHNGYLERFSEMKKEILNSLTEYFRSEKRPSNFYITGHSLGGVLAMLTAQTITQDPVMNSSNKPVIIRGVYTFGSPMLGNQLFVDWLAASIGVEKIHRVVNQNDWVPHGGMSPNGAHPSRVTEYFVPKGMLLPRSCNGGHDNTCSRQFSCHVLNSKPHGRLGETPISSKFCEMTGQVPKNIYFRLH